MLAYLVLGETFSPRQMFGGLMIIAGTLTVSVRWGASAGRFIDGQVTQGSASLAGSAHWHWQVA